jgi:hypothetical protein
MATAQVSAEGSTTDKSPAKSSAASGAKGDSASTLQGKYKYAGPKSEKEAISNIIDKILFTLDDSMRMPVKERLDMKMRVSEWIDIKQSGSKVTVHFEGRKPDVCSLEGPASGMDPEGNPAELRVAREGDKLIHTVTTAEGTRTNTFQPQADGSVKLAVELKGPRLPQPIRWNLTYKKGK